MKIRNLAAPALIAIALLVGSTGCELDEENGKPAGDPDLSVTAKDLIKEFQGNELSADEKYKGKTLEVSGKVAKIDTELLDDDKYVLEIGSGGQFEVFNVNCHDMSKEELGSLKVGNKVTAIGNFDDGGDLGVDLKNCRLK